MKFVEQCLHFGCAGETLLGIVAAPAAPGPVGVVVVVGGPQYRAGSHRQFTLLARHLASEGHAVLRFDHRGMGDSSGARRDFLDLNDDIQAAIGALRQAVPMVQQVVLWGLCDGASAALLFCDACPGTPIAGLCLVNPWVRSAQTQAATQIKHYYTRRLMEAAFWRKLLRGQVRLDRLVELGTSLRAMWTPRAAAAAGVPSALRFQDRMARAWHALPRPLLVVLSGDDLTAQEFAQTVQADPAWRGALQRPQLTRLDLPKADHSLSGQAARLAVEQATARWVGQLAAAHAGVAA